MLRAADLDGVHRVAGDLREGRRSRRLHDAAGEPAREAHPLAVDVGAGVLEQLQRLGRVPELDPHLLEHGVGVLLDQRQVLLGEHLERLQRAGDVRHADRVRDGARGLPGGAAAAAATAGGLGHVSTPIMRAPLGGLARAAAAPATLGRIGDAAGRQGDGGAQPLVGVGVVRDRHRTDEELLEARLDRGLDLLDAAHDLLDLGAGRAVEQRDARAGAGGVAGRRDVGGIAVGHEAEHERVHRVDVVAERAGEPDPVDMVDPVALAEQHAARVKRRLRELDLADVVLGDRQQRLAVGEDVGEGAAVGDDPRRARGERAVDRAVRREHAREVQLGDRPR